jgi:hypothetical protein
MASSEAWFLQTCVFGGSLKLGMACSDFCGSLFFLASDKLEKEETSVEVLASWY